MSEQRLGVAGGWRRPNQGRAGRNWGKVGRESWRKQSQEQWHESPGCLVWLDRQVEKSWKTLTEVLGVRAGLGHSKRRGQHMGKLRRLVGSEWERKRRVM